MLCKSRSVDQVLWIEAGDHKIEIVIRRISQGTVHLGIKAPDEVRFYWPEQPERELTKERDAFLRISKDLNLPGRKR